MKCDCGESSRTTDTRKIAQGVWRRRVCNGCGAVFTTLEQRCETKVSPYRSGKTGQMTDGQVVAPPVPAVARPNPPEKRATAKRAPSPAGKFEPAPAQFAPPPVVAHARRASVPVDRIEDLKFERQQNGYGWDE